MKDKDKEKVKLKLKYVGYLLSIPLGGECLSYEKWLAIWRANRNNNNSHS